MIAKFWHVIGVVLMLGNVIVTGLWAHWALERNEPAVDAFAARAVIRADIACTLLGGFLQTVSGAWMVVQGGRSVFHTPWLQSPVDFGARRLAVPNAKNGRPPVGGRPSKTRS